MTAQVCVSGSGRSWSAPLDPAGMLIGRSEECGLLLDDLLVSRRHARICLDPFDRWIVEDLQSHNGVWVNGRRVKSHAVAPGDRVVIGPFALTFSVPGDRRIRADQTMVTRARLAEELPEATEVQVRPDVREAVSGARLKELDEIGERLAGVTDSDDLYPEACRCLAKTPGAAVLVLRLAAGPGDPPPEALACEVHGTLPSENANRATDVRLSRRVIQAVREFKQAVMGSNVRSGPGHLGLTVVEGQRPRAVYAVPITGGEDWTDVLYVEVPAEWADMADLDFIRAVARQVGFAARSLLGQEQAARIRQIDQQLAMARELQERLVPQRLDLSAAVDIALTYEPAFWVGGDYCDVWSLADGRIAFTVADVMGKGLPAALIMANLQAVLRTAVGFRPEPAAVASSISDHLMRHLSGRMFVTLVLGLLDPATGGLEYLNAGHILPVLVPCSGSPSELDQSRNLPLGLLDATYTSHRMTLEPGEGLVVMTDGVTESRSPDGEFLGPAGILRALEGLSSASSEDLVRAVTRAASDFRQQLPAHDDLTVLALRRRAKGT